MTAATRPALTRALLGQLRDRLRAATGPDRELDGRMCLLMDVKGNLAGRDWIEKWLALPPDDRSDAEDYIPLLTASIEVAVALVPTGWEWTVSNRAKPPHAGRAYIHNRELIYTGMSGMVPNPKRQHAECTASTPALALCLARVEYEIARLAVGAADQS